LHTDDFKMPVDVAIFEGGPFLHLWRHPESATPRMGPLYLRTILVPVIAWLPLLALSIWSGLAWSGTPVPFLYDFEVHGRLLLALPLLLIEERHADRILIPALGIFLERRIIRADDRMRFKDILAWMGAWNRSYLVLVILIVTVYVTGHLIWVQGLITQVATWYGERSDSKLHLTLPGYWYAWVAIPLFQFILYRWYFRLLLWWGLLMKIARLDLHLIATHPDRAGGIGFLGEKIYAFVPFLIAQGIMAAGLFSNRIFYGQRQLQQMWPELVTFGVFVGVLVLGPLTAFTWPLILAKRNGRAAYNLLAVRYVEEFERKWMRGGAPETEALVGNPDIQSLADLAGGAEVVRQMRFVPFGYKAILKVMVPFALPIVPLVFTVIPATDVLRRLAEILL
jgi:hypothetical protein